MTVGVFFCYYYIMLSIPKIIDNTLFKYVWLILYYYTIHSCVVKYFSKNISLQVFLNTFHIIIRNTSMEHFKCIFNIVHYFRYYTLFHYFINLLFFSRFIYTYISTQKLKCNYHSEQNDCRQKVYNLYKRYTGWFV